MADDKPIFVRMSPEERERLERAAERDGFQIFSEWVRVVLRKRARELLGDDEGRKGK